MEKKSFLVFITLITLISIMGCSKKVEKVNFLLNSHDIVASDAQPEEEDDLKKLKVFVKDTIYLQDISEPAKSVKQRDWDIDGDGAADVEQHDFFPISFSEVGFNKITLCINDDNCISKWIYVDEFEEDLKPFVFFKEPEDELGTVTKARDRNLPIKVELNNVFDKEELNLIVNNKPKSDFVFDSDKNLLLADVRLEKGKNTIEVIATTAEGESSQTIEWSYSSKVPSRKPSKQVIPPPPPKPRASCYDRILNQGEERVDCGGPCVACPSCFDGKKNQGELDIDCGGPCKRCSLGNARGIVGPHLPPSDRGACVNLVRNPISVTITPKKDIELESFHVYTNSCGRMAVHLSGGGLSERLTTNLVKGKSQVVLNANIDAQLSANTTYTLTCTPKTGGGCSATEPPGFENGKSCSISVKTSSIVTLNQSNNLIVYDLKFIY